MKSSSILKLALLTTALISLSACNMGQRLSELGEAPALSKVEDPTPMASDQPVKFPQPQQEGGR